MKRTALILALVLLAGCARSEEASLVQPDSNQGYNKVGRVGSPEQDDREPAIGQWRAALQENAQALEFGPMGTAPLFSLLCAGNRQVLLQRHGGAPAGPLPGMQLAIGDLNERLAVTAGGGTIPLLRVTVPLDSPIATAMGQGGQPLQVRLGDGEPLILPPSPLVRDYLANCTNAAPPAQGGNSAAPVGNTPAPAPANGSAPAPGNAASPAPAPQGNTAQPRS